MTAARTAEQRRRLVSGRHRGRFFVVTMVTQSAVFPPINTGRRQGAFAAWRQKNGNDDWRQLERPPRRQINKTTNGVFSLSVLVHSAHWADLIHADGEIQNWPLSGRQLVRTSQGSQMISAST